MRTTHEFLAQLPFDVYSLTLFQLIAHAGSFTRAAQQAGLTQSAITRQIQGMESQLGVALFERTTRRVSLTPAGQFLLGKAETIVCEAGRTFRQLREGFAAAPKTIAVGVSRSIGLAYLPGFFVSFRQKHPAIRTEVIQQTSAEILAGLDASVLQAGIIGAPDRLPAGVKITHRFRDEFVLIAPPQVKLPSPRRAGQLFRALAKYDWILLGGKSNTARRLREWLARLDVGIQPAMEADTFDLIVNLVAMGLGLSFVPHRALPIFPKARSLQRITLRPAFSRDVVVVVRKDRKPPEHLTQFIDSILFGRINS